MQRGLVSAAVKILGSLSLVAACTGNQDGNVQATRVGDLSNPLTQRGDSFADVARLCELSEPSPRETGLRRRPYLQRLSAQGVDLLWTTAAATRDGAVVVTRPDGAIISLAGAVQDSTAHPPDGAVQWQASISDLEADTTYCYELRLGGEAVRRGGFHTAPAAGSGRSLRLVAFGDSGDASTDQRAVLDQVRTMPMDLVLHTGDVAYDQGTRGELEERYFSVYADLLENFAVFPVSGNHDYATEQAAPFREAFDLPANGGPEGEERWYSFDWGDVHLVALDTERIDETQARWLDADLAAHRLPWTIVYFHRPPFSSGSHGGDADVRRLFVPLLEKYAVPLVLSGHDHDYERTTPINGVTYVVTGGGGVGTRPVGHSSFTAFAESVCHFVYVVVDGDSMTVHAVDGTGQPFDSVLLRR